MKKCFTLFLIFAPFLSFSQLISTNPVFVTQSAGSIEITMDATYGNKGLLNYGSTNDVYVHIGVITNFSSSATDWKYSKFTWATTNSNASCIYLGNNKWKYTISGSIRSFFGISNANEQISKIAILFRSGNGSVVQRNADGSDMYISVNDDAFQLKIVDPYRQPTFKISNEPISKRAGDSITFSVKTNVTANINLFLNNELISSASSIDQLSSRIKIKTGGLQKLRAVATKDNISLTDSIEFYSPGVLAIEALPAGIKDGINYLPGDTSAILVLYAPKKQYIQVIGDFNDWQKNVQYEMKMTPDSTRFWIKLDRLTKETEYAYQFAIDGSIVVADYNAEKILDPNNDGQISIDAYPMLKQYPSGKTTGIVSVLQTGRKPYAWQVNDFKRPDKRNLIIYEMLLRDFLQQSNWATLKDTISYFKRLGVNVIELMPFTEFEGNNSWGYNISYHFAADKFYGTSEALKNFIDECHRQGIAVVLDMVFNHVFGESPLVKMYWDASNNRPAENNPWLNPTAKHPYNVGYDFNHESQATKDLVDRVMDYWLTEFRLDGFRWDLSKGFTQTSNPNNVAAWGAYDASRIAIWKRIYQKMQTISSGAYCILEHFADNSEERELAESGMMLWGNMNYNFNEATMGYVNNSNFEWGLSSKRGWSVQHLVTYPESHDEERLMYKNITYGNASGTYNVKDLNVALKRHAMAAAFWSMMPGPKMVWQFSELGYDRSITWCPTTNTVPTPYPSDQCRLDKKPPEWGYLQSPDRIVLFKTFAALLNLRITPNYAFAFTDGSLKYDFVSALKWLTLDSDSIKIVVVGNFDVTPQTVNITFPSSGSWYSYLSPTTRNATGQPESISLQPGEYYVYTNKNIGNQLITGINELKPDDINQSMVIYPNPVTSQSKLAIDISDGGYMKMQLWDMNGRLLSIQDLGYRMKGRHTFDLGRLTYDSAVKKQGGGMYVVTVQWNGKTIRKQIQL